MKNYQPTACHFIVPVDVYRKDVLFMFGYSRKKIIDLLQQREEPTVKEVLMHFKKYKESYKGLCIIGKVGQVFITMPVIPSTPDHFGTLAHEIFHGVEGIMSDIGNHHPEDEADESWAHLIGYITAECFHHLNQYYPD